MTIATFDLTEHTQMSIRGTTGTHPDSEFVFGIYISSQENYAEELLGKYVMPDITAYDDMDWSKAVELAKWVNDMDKAHPSWEFTHLTDTCVVSYFPHNYCGNDGPWFGVIIGTTASTRTFPLGSFDDRCEWGRAVEMAKWILEWDERLKEGEE